MSRANDGTWIQMYTGTPIWPTDPREEDISIHDIAHALALSCRWTGHVRRHFSVAQHSVMVSYLVPKEDALAALLHDASEAYISDIARPTKVQLQNYHEIEARLMKVILARFGLLEKLPDTVKKADDKMLFSEARDLMRPPPMPWIYVSSASGLLDRKVRPWPIWWSEFRFLWRFGELTGTRWQTMKEYAGHKLWDLWYYGL